MTIKKVKIIDVFIIFSLCFLFHFIYQKFPNIFTSLFFPVNESIWEHMKLFLTPYLLITLIDYNTFKIFKINNNNLLLSTVVSILFSIIFYLTLYIPINNTFTESMFINISLMFITISLSQLISYWLLTKEKLIINKTSPYVIVLILLLFSYLTYKPIHNNLFYDKTNNKYGINIYL